MADDAVDDGIAIAPNCFEEITEDEFFGLDVFDEPPLQIDDELQYLHEQDVRDIQLQSAMMHSSSSSDLNWSDNLISSEGEPVTFNLDRAIKESWENLVEEVEYIQANLKTLLGYDSDRIVSSYDIYNLSFGESSAFATSFCKELSTNYSTYCRFMSQ